MFGMMASPKVKMINVRLTPEVHDAFKIACDLRGASMSSLLHQFVVRTIREEREREPNAFATKQKGEVIAHIGSEKAEIRRQFEQGMPVAPTGTKIPLHKSTTQAKRKAR